jgi:hypothetical protein
MSSKFELVSAVCETLLSGRALKTGTERSRTASGLTTKTGKSSTQVRLERRLSAFGAALEFVKRDRQVMMWSLASRGDAYARNIADRHYNRQIVGAAMFTPPGKDDDGV